MESSIMPNIYRSNVISDLDENMVGKEVTVAGWVSTIRDHGGITFVDLRDYYGIVQLMVRDSELLNGINRETVVSVKGTVTLRDENNFNPKLKTGKIEITVSEITILGKSQSVLPFEIMESTETNDELRMKYRYLDLRNPVMQEKLRFRADVAFEFRSMLRDLGFLEVTTPILTASSPEGSRDYLVPRRIHKGKFYALPQAPQQFKQLLMTAGIDRYFQIAPCFRDEDARADRSPGEFYQVDIEMAFATQEDVFKVMEYVMPKIFEKYSKGMKVDPAPFVRIPYRESLEKYGSDKPDLRNPIIIHNLTDVFKNTEFKAFSGQVVKAIAVETGEKPRSFYDTLTQYMVDNGAKGLAWIKVEADNHLNGPIVKFLSEEEQAQMIAQTGAKEGYAIFLIADKYSTATKLSGILRTELGNRLGLSSKAFTSSVGLLISLCMSWMKRLINSYFVITLSVCLKAD